MSKSSEAIGTLRAGKVPLRTNTTNYKTATREGCVSRLNLLAFTHVDSKFGHINHTWKPS